MSFGEREAEARQVLELGLSANAGVCGEQGTWFESCRSLPVESQLALPAMGAGAQRNIVIP